MFVHDNLEEYMMQSNLRGPVFTHNYKDETYWAIQFWRLVALKSGHHC